MRNHLSIAHGHVIAKLAEREFVLSPTFMHIDRIGDPHEIVETFAMLHSLSAAVAIRTAMLVITCCSDDDLTDLIGYYDEKLNRVAGAMPASEMVIIAMHLMKHGIVGKATGGDGGGEYSPTFDASEYMDAAVIHFGMTQREAWALTMTQFSRMLDMKFPAIKELQKTEITPAKYDQAVADYEVMKAKRLAKAAANGE